MTRPMHRWWAACAALWLVAAGCGGGSATNGKMTPKITSAPPQTATVGAPYNYVVMAEGMTPMAFDVVSGPERFEIDPTSGVVAWTPTEAGTVSIEIRASNLAGSDTQSFEVEVESRTGPVFTTDPPTEATVAAPYAYDPMVVADGEVSWSAPIAPSGLAVDPQTGAVRWIPSADQVGDRRIVIRATETDSDRSTDQSFTVTVVDTGGPAIITSAAPDRVYAGEIWSYDAAAAGAPTIEWSLVSPSTGTPASGVTIVTDPPRGTNVTIEWDTASTSPGQYTVAVRVDNGLGLPDTQQSLVTVEPRPPVPEIDLFTSPPPPTVFVGTTYVYDVDLVAGTESAGVSFDLVDTTVPEGLAITIDPDTGVVSFTASEFNGEIQYSYTVRVENVLGEGDEETIVVEAVYPPAEPVLTVTPQTSFTLEVGQSFADASANATGNPVPTLSIVGTLPDFVEFDPLTGLLSASSTQPVPGIADIGTYSFDIVATNAEGTDSQTIDITVVAAPPAVDSITPAAGRRQSDVPVVVRGAGFVASASPTIRLERAGYTETLSTNYIDDATLSAVVPTDVSRPSGVYDVVVDQGSTTTLAKRFTVTQGDGSTLNGTISTDRTLTALGSPHVVTGNVTIEAGATVTMEPGAVLMFAGNTNLRIDVGTGTAGGLVADGGRPGVDDQIVFTRFQDVGGAAPTGHYRGLRFGANNLSAITRLRNVVVEFGGRRSASTDQGAIEVLGSSAPSIRDSLVRESVNYGLYAQAGAGSAMDGWFDFNQLTANARGPISIGADEVSTLGSTLELLGNGQDRIYVRGANVTRAVSTWTNYGVPYFLSAGLAVRGGGTLRLAPGTELRFAPGERLRVSTGGASPEEGKLVAEGSADAPIRMVADSAPWDGLFLDDDVQAGTILRHVRIQGFSGDAVGGVRIDPGSPAVVERCLVQSSMPGSVGVHLATSAGLASFENNVLDVQSLSVDAGFGGSSDALVPSNRYEAPVRVRGGSVSGLDMTWSKPIATSGVSQPIVVDGNLILTDGSLQIAAGNRLEMALDVELTAIDSRLVVSGTASEPVVFTPADGVAFWDRIQLRGSGVGGRSQIAHAVIESAGSDPLNGPAEQRAGIVVRSSGSSSAIPIITETTVTNSNGYGMTFGDGNHCDGACDENTITGSRFSALRMYANFIGRFGTGNAFAGNNLSGTPGHDGVWVDGDLIDVSATWPANDVPYVVQGDIELRQSYPLDPIPVMHLAPGAELRFAESRRLRVGDGNEGVLEARGTATMPIVFTSIDAGAPVFWRGIEFHQGADGSILDHVVVSFGGRGSSSGNVNFRIGSVVTVGVATFSYSEGYGAVTSVGSAPAFAGPPSDRVYELNGQASNPGTGDPAFDCVLDLSTGICAAL